MLQLKQQEDCTCSHLRSMQRMPRGGHAETGDKVHRIPTECPIQRRQGREWLHFHSKFLWCCLHSFAIYIISKSNNSNSNSNSNNTRRKQSNLMKAPKSPMPCTSKVLTDSDWIKTPRAAAQCRLSSKFNHKRGSHVLHRRHLPTRRKGFGIQTRAVCTQHQLGETALTPGEER